MKEWNLKNIVKTIGISDRKIQRLRVKYEKFLEYNRVFFEYSDYYFDEALKSWVSYELNLKFPLPDLTELVLYLKDIPFVYEFKRAERLEKRLESLEKEKLSLSLKIENLDSSSYERSYLENCLKKVNKKIDVTVELL